MVRATTAHPGLLLTRTTQTFRCPLSYSKSAILCLLNPERWQAAVSGANCMASHQGSGPVRSLLETHVVMTPWCVLIKHDKQNTRTHVVNQPSETPSAGEVLWSSCRNCRCT